MKSSCLILLSFLLTGVTRVSKDKAEAVRYEKITPGWSRALLLRGAIIRSFCPGRSPEDTDLLPTNMLTAQRRVVLVLVALVSSSLIFATRWQMSEINDL